MRISMIMDTSFPPDARVENEAKALQDQGHDVFLFHIDYENKPLGEIYEGIEITRYSAGKMLYKLSALVYTFPFYNWIVKGKIREFIRKSQPDLLHIHDMVIAGAVFRANESFFLPVILDLHENRPEIMKLYKHVNQQLGKWLINLDKWKRKQRELMQKADHVILVTEEARETASEFDAIPKEKTTALPNVVRLDKFRIDARDPGIEKLTKNRFTLLYIGDTSIRRGTMNALETADLLQEKIPNLQMIFVGNSSQDELLHTFVQERGLSDKVRFEGWQDPERLSSYINASDICLSPLLRNLHHDTTYANKLFQYMACGKPVVASDCPAQKKVVESENCGVIYRADDVGDLARVILELFDDPDKRKQLGDNGARAVQERWNWEKTGRNLIKAYEAVSVRNYQ
jgi:glycosyltransferase involved in cell wall biosynthesis